ncbi:MAG: DUF6502 family protein [Gammaproteobacteria bacterium]|nr:DUF6502 family protein [Gammaproteobacteria bacterium]
MGSNDKQQQILQTAIYRLLKPLVRLLLRNGLAFAVFSDIAKKAYVDVAADEFKLDNKKQTDTRIATITGIQRKEVARLRKIDAQLHLLSLENHQRAARIVYHWVHDADYKNGNGLTRDLDFDDTDISFCQLVKSHSGDMTPRAILDDLLKVGVVTQLDNGKIRLLERAYVPAHSELEKLKILGRDVAGLVNTIDRNIYQKQKPAFFQRKVYYDNLPAESIPIILEFVEKQGQAFLEQADKTMAQYDRDVNPAVGGHEKIAAGIGLYYFEDPDAE